MTAVPDSRPVDAIVHGIVERHLNAALAELRELGMTDDDHRVYFLEVLADGGSWIAGEDDPRWTVVTYLLTHDQPPFNDEPVSTQVLQRVVSFTDALVMMIETRGNEVDHDYSRMQAEQVDADFAVLGRIVKAATAWHLLPVPGTGLRS